MARINLLPWRAERRRQRQKEFMAMLGVSAAAAMPAFMSLSNLPSSSNASEQASSTFSSSGSYPAGSFQTTKIS